ncbi:MAG: hypothetical protein HY741_21200 [Chloroflexi bacterium]|nr:hypothetical protein [Chloroflexota bacterium]
MHPLTENLAWHDKADPKKKGSYRFKFHFSNSGDLSIQPPTDFSTHAPRTPVANDTQFPLPDEVENFASGGTYEGQINFQTTLTISAIVAFYRQALTARGAKEETALTTIDERGFGMVFSGWKEGKWLVIQGVNLNATRNTNMRLEDAR